MGSRQKAFDHFGGPFLGHDHAFVCVSSGRRGLARVLVAVGGKEVVGVHVREELLADQLDLIPEGQTHRAGTMTIPPANITFIMDSLPTSIQTEFALMTMRTEQTILLESQSFLCRASFQTFQTVFRQLADQLGVRAANKAVVLPQSEDALRKLRGK